MSKVNKDKWTKFPPYIDSTMFSSMKSCSRSFFNRYCRNLSFTEQSIHLVAGAAFAKGFEVTRKLMWEDAVEPQEAIMEGALAIIDGFGDFDTDTQTKNPYNMIRAFVSYWQEHGTITDHLVPLKLKEEFDLDSSSIEFNFRIPLPINNPDNGEPLVLTGRLDMLATRNGFNYIVDEKTTGALNATWGMQWDMRGQFLCYAWACRQMGIPIAGAIVRGVGIYKTMIKHQEVVVSTPKWKTDRWYQELLTTVRRTVAEYEAGEFGYSFSDACSQYSGCSFKNLCNVQNEEPLVGQYNRVVWHPEAGEQEILYKVRDDEVDSAMADAFGMGS